MAGALSSARPKASNVDMTWAVTYISLIRVDLHSAGDKRVQMVSNERPSGPAIIV